MNYLFIGFGNLANAIYKGLPIQDDKYAYYDPHIESKSPQKFTKLAEAISWANIIFLTVKPQNSTDVLQQIKHSQITDKLFVSPMAGITIAQIEKYLSTNSKIIRIMPNLAIQYQKSTTAYCTNNSLNNNSKSNEQLQDLMEKLNLLGKTVKIEENLFNKFTAIFGSGPAFILKISQAFEKDILNLNIVEDESKLLLIQLLEGTLEFIKKNKNTETHKLIDRIASKGGTTEAGLNKFNENEIEKQLLEVLKAVEKRGEELSS